jgi:hypothetical protein
MLLVTKDPGKFVSVLDYNSREEMHVSYRSSNTAE